MEQIQPRPILGNDRVLKGRSEVPPEVANPIQLKLFEYMIGDAYLKSLPEDDINVLMLQWMEQYVLGDFNGFAEYCNAHATDGFIERVNQGNLTTEDLEAMKIFLEESPGGGSFIVRH